MDSNQQIIILLLIAAIAYYYLENEKKETSITTGTNSDNDNDFNEILGFRPYSTSLAGSEQLPAASLQECYDLAVEKDALAYTYRNEKHDEQPLKNTCVLFSHVGTGEITGNDWYLSGMYR